MMRSGLTERQIAACGHSKQAQDKQLHPDRPLRKSRAVCSLLPHVRPPAAANVPRMKPFRTSLNYEDGKNMLGSAFNALLGGVVQELKEKQDRLESQIGA